MSDYLSCHKAGPLRNLHQYQNNVYNKKCCPWSEFLHYSCEQFLLTQPRLIQKILPLIRISSLFLSAIPLNSAQTYSNYDADAGYLFELLGWKYLASQQQIQRATMVNKSLHGLAPDYLCSKFERRKTAYNLRDSENKLNVPLPRTNYYKNSFSYSGATL